jgi:iron complex transport system ATP-binding protein
MVMDRVQFDIKDLAIGYTSKRSNIPVFSNINASFSNGQLVGVVGNNGVGKSTFLRTIAGIQPKLNGDVFVNDELIETIEKTALAKLISIVLTEKIAGFNLTVTDLVSMGRVPYTNSFNDLQKNDTDKIAECIQITGLSNYAHVLLAELSDGLFQKAMIAKGLAQQTPVILLDEPTAYLDFNSKHELFELLKDLTIKNDKCVIASSHDIELLLRYSSHLLVFGDENEYELMETKNCISNSLFRKVTNNYFR